MSESEREYDGKETGRKKYLIKKRKKHHSQHIKSEVNQISGLMEKMEIKKHSLSHSLVHSSWFPSFSLDVRTIYDKKS